MKKTFISIWVYFATTAFSGLITSASFADHPGCVVADEPARNVPSISQSQINALKRISQLTEINWQPVLQNTMPSRRGFFSGDTETGVPYSSARGVGRWIGYDISLETFMTAVRNPKSVLYTENLREDPYNVPNAATYYGLTCSSLVQYAFRGDFFWGTLLVHEDPERANMTLIEEQSADGIELCDILNSAVRTHMEIVTGITYSEGAVDSIEVTDIVHGGPRRRKYTPAGFNKYLNDRDYYIYRYNITDNIPYVPSRYVAVGDEESQEEVVYNEVLALDRGNKTNYVQGTPVKFNIMDSEADLLIIKKDGATLDIVDITKTGVIEKTYKDYGKYSAYCVMKDESVSDPVEFIVSNIIIDVPDIAEAGGEITIKFSAEACVPRYIMRQVYGTFGGGLSKTLTEQEISEGSVTISYNDTGSFYIIVNGYNEFGGVYSNREHIKIVKQAGAWP